jgi:hypothetical protein
VSDKIKIQNKTGIGYDTEITQGDGSPLYGITGVTIHIKHNDIIEADIRLGGALTDVEAAPTFYMSDPTTGEWRAVKAIEWADGERSNLE